MADWPDADEVKQVLDITSEDWDDTIDRVVAAAIHQVQQDVGNWDDYEDEPDDSLAQAALRLAELIGLRENAPGSVSNDATYLRLVKGHRRKFGIA